MKLNIFGTNRSPGWKKIRDQFIKDNPCCAACGSGKKLEVHHIEPFHLNPSRELDIANLIVLCSSCHFVFGHLMDYSSWNIDIIEDSKVYLNKVKNKPYTIKGMNNDTKYSVFGNILSFLFYRFFGDYRS